jgi:SNF2 family DNA or RNA helicase
MLNNNGRKGTIGFALTILQRRLASSPEAIYQSLRRRRERLESLAKEIDAINKDNFKKLNWEDEVEFYNLEDSEEIDDFEDSPEGEIEALEEQVVDLASAASTLSELKSEISTLYDLEKTALKVKNSGNDKKWKELSQILMNKPECLTKMGSRKLIIFSEHRDTLNYLQNKISDLIQNSDAIVTIHGGLNREVRRKTQLAFTQDNRIYILIATDAAGEGINLQRAHLMVNYDLPWNPNRLEQRFGRIHRIGQTEVCHCWTL